jgi:hypothetical protein
MRQKAALEELSLLRAELAKSSFQVGRYRVDLAVQKAFLEDAKGDARVPILKEIKWLEVSIRVTEEQNAETPKTVQRLREEAVKLSTEPVDMQMIREQIRNLDAWLSKFAAEKDKLGVELRAPPRVVLLERPE